jgi:hypothetical protein
LEVDISIPQMGNPRLSRTIRAADVEDVTVDDRGDGASYMVNDLTRTGVQNVSVNLHEAGSPGGSSDQITVNGSHTAPNQVVISADTNLPAGTIYDSNGQPIKQITGDETEINLTTEVAGAAGGVGAQYQVLAAIPKTSDVLSVNTGPANDTVSVESTQASGTVNVNTGAGDDSIVVGAIDHVLDYLLGPLNVYAGSGHNQITFDESQSYVSDAVTLTSSQLIRYTRPATVTRNDADGNQITEVAYPFIVNYVAHGSPNVPGDFAHGVFFDTSFGATNLYIPETGSSAPLTVTAHGTYVGARDKISIGYDGAFPQGRKQVVVNSVPLVPLFPTTVAQSTLFLLRSPLMVTGNGPTSLEVDDEGTHSGRTYTVGTQAAPWLGYFQASGSWPIDYQDLNLTVNAANQSNQIFVNGVAAKTTATIDTGSGANRILVGEPLLFPLPLGIQYILDTIQGALSVNGGGGTNDLVMNDSFNKAAHAYELSAATMQRFGGSSIASISFTRVTTMELYEPATANDFTSVAGTAAGTTVTVYTGDGTDSLAVTTMDHVLGPLAFQWQQGLKKVLAHDSLAAGKATYTVNVGESSATLLRTGAAAVTFNYQGSPPDPMANIDLFAGLNHADVINVLAVAAGTMLQITGGKTSNDVLVGDTNQHAPNPDQLDVVQGALDVIGEGNTKLELDDKKGPATSAYRQGAGSLTFSPSLPAIQFAQISTTVLDSAPSATVNVLGVASGATAEINLSGTGSTVVVGSALKQLLGAIQGTVDIHGTGSDSLTINDQKGPPGSVYTVNGNELVDVGSLIKYDNVGFPKLDGCSKGATYLVIALPSSALTIQAQGAGNRLQGPDQANAWAISGQNAGTLDGRVTFSSVQSLTGGADVDAFVIGAGAKVTGMVTGGGGSDWLDYSAYQTPVAVNVVTGKATGIGGGISNIQNVHGGQGGNTLTGNAQGNILIGGAGADVIRGGASRSILIGDGGPDVINGGPGDAILIGGTTDYDSSSLKNDLALESILAEWQSQSTSYQNRITHILTGNGGLNGSHRLAGQVTVFDDHSPNMLTGGLGQNWFFEGAQDKIFKLKSGERVNQA